MFHFGAALHDLAYYFVSRDQWIPGDSPVIVYHMNVAVANTASIDLDDAFMRSKWLCLVFVGCQGFAFFGSRKAVNFHAVSLPESEETEQKKEEMTLTCAAEFFTGPAPYGPASCSVAGRGRIVMPVDRQHKQAGQVYKPVRKSRELPGSIRATL